MNRSSATEFQLGIKFPRMRSVSPTSPPDLPVVCQSRWIPSAQDFITRSASRDVNVSTANGTGLLHDNLLQAACAFSWSSITSVILANLLNMLDRKCRLASQHLAVRTRSTSTRRSTMDFLDGALFTACVFSSAWSIQFTSRHPCRCHCHPSWKTCLWHRSRVDKAVARCGHAPSAA